MRAFEGVEDVALDTLLPHPHNPREGDVDAIELSLNAHGQYRPIVVNSRNRVIIAGHHLWKAAQRLGWETVSVAWLDADEDEHVRIMLADNRTADLGSYNEAAILSLLEELDRGDLGLVGTGYTDDDLATLAAAQSGLQTDLAYEEGDKREPRKRSTPIDLIASIAGPVYITHILYALGWHPGIITTAAGAARKILEATGRPPMFMDNEWHDYDHDQHIKTLAEFHPKYATVRDLVTKAQAREHDVRYYSIAETLGMAEEVAQHADNVILIPKYDCIDDLPATIGGKRVVLGYSVHSSYGGTPIRPQRFAGHPVHLLGGSWKKQRALLNLLGDDVVSLDNNNMLMVSRFANVNRIGGSSNTLLEMFPEFGEEVRGSAMTLSLVMSAAFIAHEVATVFDGLVEPEAITTENGGRDDGADDE